MIANIFRERLAALQPGLRFLFQRCDLNLEGDYLWIKCSADYQHLIQKYGNDVAVWLKISGLGLIVRGIGFEQPEGRSLWLAQSDLLQER